MSDAPPPDLRELLRTGLLAAVVLLVAFLAFHGPGIATGAEMFFTHDLAGSDLWHLHVPVKAFYAEELSAGRLPLWCPDLGTGFPLFAEGQVGALYPPNLVLFSLLPLPLALNISILLSTLLAGIFAAMLARQLGAARRASVVGGAVFAFSGFILVHLKHVNQAAAAAWIPLMLLLLERYAANRRRRTLAFLAIVVAVTWLAGHPQTAYNHLLVAGGWGSWLLCRNRRRAPVRLAAGLLLAVAAGLLLASPQILATRELNALGPRAGGMSLEDATRFDPGPELLLGFLAPHPYGDPGELVEEPVAGTDAVRLRGYEPPVEASIFWENTGYVGLLPLLLAAAAAALTFRRRETRGLLALLVVSVLLALGPAGGLFHLAWRAVPGFDLFRFHSRFLLTADLALAVLAALGLTALAARTRLRRLVPTAAAVVCLADLLLAFGDHNPTIETDRWLVPPPTVEAIRERAGERAGPLRIVVADRDRRVFRNAWLRARGWKGDLAPYDVAHLLPDPNLGALWGVATLRIYFPLYPRWMSHLSEALAAPPYIYGRRGGLERVGGLYGARYVVTPDAPGESRKGEPELPVLATFPGDRMLEPVRPGDGGLAWRGGPPFEIRVRENPSARPRAVLLWSARAVPDGEEIRALLSDDFDPEREVLLHPAAGMPGLLRQLVDDPIEAPVEFLADGPREVRLAVEAPADAWLFLADTFYPGWEAVVDGEPATIYRANVAGRAVQVPGGRHEIVFTYRPTWRVLALVLAAMGFLLTVVLYSVRRPATRR